MLFDVFFYKSKKNTWISTNYVLEGDNLNQLHCCFGRFLSEAWGDIRCYNKVAVYPSDSHFGLVSPGCDPIIDFNVDKIRSIRDDIEFGNVVKLED